MLSRVFRLKGDFIPDGRLIDYFTSVMSTFESPALDGRQDSEDRLRKDLTEMGVFDHRMPLYQLIRLRKFHQMGYSGFEHRHFSVFENVMPDMGGAADIQLLITALAQKYIFSKDVSHEMIPDVPAVESERRQAFFCSATGVPTFFVKTRTPNRFLMRILKRVEKTRASRRYPGYTRVIVQEYRLALIRMIRIDGSDLLESFKFGPLLDDLEKRLLEPEVNAAWGRMTNGIIDQGIMTRGGKGPKASHPISVPGKTFNTDAEAYYATTLRNSHIRQGFDCLEKVFERMDLWARYREPEFGRGLEQILGKNDMFSICWFPHG